ncbi:MAG: MFS transporter [Anaerolineaceae bacterium]|nr:MAG: MFS transporter [Anaerolineaceae bacterium]
MTRDLRRIGIALLCWGMGEGLFVYLLPLYLEQLGADSVQIGLILGIAAFSLTITHIPAGALSDRIGRKRVMIAGWISGSLSVMVMFLAPNLPLFVIGVVMYHLTAFVISPLNSYITAAQGNWTVARAITTTSAMFNTGTIIGAFLGGTIGEFLGLRNVFGLAIIPIFVSTMIAFRFQRQPIEIPKKDGRYQAVLSNVALGRFLGLASIVLFGMYLSWPLTPNYLQNVRHVTVREIGTLGSINALGLVLLNLSIGRLVAPRGYVIAQFVVGASTLLLWLGTGIPFFALGYFLAGGFRLARSLTVAQAEGLVSRSNIGLVYGITETVMGLVAISGPPVAGLLYRVSPALPYPVSLGIIGGSLFLTTRFLPRLRPSAPPVEDPSDLQHENEEGIS